MPHDEARGAHLAQAQGQDNAQYLRDVIEREFPDIQLVCLGCCHLRMGQQCLSCTESARQSLVKPLPAGDRPVLVAS
jgi:hypothetical protein